MEAVEDIVEFASDRFAPVLPEDSQVNPGVYGAELAYWLCTELAKRGVVTSYPNSEDWGWYVEYVTASGSEFAVHCYNADGEKNRWLLALHRYGRKMFGRDKAPHADAAALVEGIRVLVATDGAVRDVKWLYRS